LHNATSRMMGRAGLLSRLASCMCMCMGLWVVTLTGSHASVRVSGVAQRSRFLFLERFCFDSSGGRLMMDFTQTNNDTEVENMQVVLYPDMVRSV
jgi:hypothetical protein